MILLLIASLAVGNNSRVDRWVAVIDGDTIALTRGTERIEADLEGIDSGCSVGAEADTVDTSGFGNSPPPETAKTAGLGIHPYRKPAHPPQDRPVRCTANRYA